MSMTMINWYPGHMKKTKDMIKETIDVIDIVLEIVDARIPMSSKNPEIKRFAKNKKRLILLNKSDLVGSEELNYWKKYFIDNDFADEVVAISAEKGTNMKLLYQKIDELSKDKIAKQKAKGLLKVSIRLMVAGIPNVGKSRLINRIVGKSKAGVGNKPGFTRGKQWVRIKDGLELLDTPGILWPKFENEEVGMNLAICGAIKDEILPVEEVAATFIGRMKELKKEKIFIDNYKLKEEDFTENNLEILYNVAIKMGMLKKNGYPDTLQAAYKILREYRSGKLGLFGIEKRS
jgi:ribosome biogenesis GTPase A